MDYFSYFTKDIIATGIVLIVVIILRFIISKLVKRFALSSQILEHRTNLVIKYQKMGRLL